MKKIYKEVYLSQFEIYQRSKKLTRRKIEELPVMVSAPSRLVKQHELT